MRIAMRSVKALWMVAALAAVFSLWSCKNNNSGNPADPSIKVNDSKETKAVQEVKIDVVYLANLYCKTTDLDKARIFLGKVTDSLFTVEKDVENNYAAVYAQAQYENSLKFYMWTDKDGEKILGVNLTESGERGHNKRSLQFFTYDANVDLVVPCKRLNEVITNKVMSMRRNLSLFVFRIPTSPEDENITMGYWEKKNKEKYNELVFVWDGHTFNVN